MVHPVSGGSDLSWLEWSWSLLLLLQKPYPMRPFRLASNLLQLLLEKPWGYQPNNLTNWIHTFIPPAPFQINPLLIDEGLAGSLHQHQQPCQANPQMRLDGEVIVDGGVNLPFNTEFNLLGSRFGTSTISFKLQSGQFQFIVLWVQWITQNQNQRQKTIHNQLFFWTCLIFL